MADYVLPEGFTGVTPYIVVDDVRKAVDYYKRAFNGEVTVELNENDGELVHAEMLIEKSIYLMISNWQEEIDMVSPGKLEGSCVMLSLCVAEADPVFNRAVSAGAKVVKPLMDQYYGDRAGMIKDPLGHTWIITARQEDVSTDEMKQRFISEGLSRTVH